MNRLKSSRSPYLLQHADNPVDWWEWGTEAFDEARRRDVPVLLSVGYAACHWCHVMAGESFEDEATAVVVNERFVAIKVDREERPDVDAVYMRATTALTRQGGWPMTVFTTPDGRPFHAGTYFPPTPRGGMPSFTQLLLAVDEAWRERRPQVEDTAQRLSEAVGGGGTTAPLVDVPTAGTDLLPPSLLGDAVAGLLSEEDTVHGGLGGSPKFPPSAVLAFLLREGSPDAHGLAARTLRAMAHSGMYDQVEGGFARYSVDAGWVVPHFEKMLYDNAQLARVYARWAVTTDDPADAGTGARVALETCDWMLGALGTDAGGLASALDADTPAPAEQDWPVGLPTTGLPTTTHGVEGLTYVWTAEALRDALGEDDGAWAADLLGVTDRGTFEHGTSTARLTRDVWSDGGEADRWSRVRATLRQVRSARPQPARDDKVVAAWNGLAVAALAEAGALLGRPDLVTAAQRVADVLLQRHAWRDADGGLRLRRVSRDGEVGVHAGVLEDHGDVATGLLVLHGVDGDPRWSTAAEQLCDTMTGRFVDPAGRWQDTASDEVDTALAAALGGAGGLVDPADNAHPSGPSAATGACLHAAALTGRGDLRDAAGRALVGAAPLMAQAPRFAGWWLAVATAAADGPREVAVVGTDGDPARDDLHQVALRSPAPGLVVSRGEPGATEPALLRDRPAPGGATAYVCRGFVCDAPTTDREVLARALTR
ncbi:thioredoxin domain-containing protein [Aquipuribacter sp. MA13-6]|uniref:thioredoxin domain-containing protein n=1 Tax=unclassified Aquipuribacter TaxID=2635084 RepID=UPI003EEF6183